MRPVFRPFLPCRGVVILEGKKMIVEKEKTIWAEKKLSPIEKLVLIRLTLGANKENITWLDIDSIKIDCGCSKTAATKAIRKLRAKGLIKTLKIPMGPKYYGVHHLMLGSKKAAVKVYTFREILERCVNEYNKTR